jgi:SAM-dependent methyltransferase
MWRSRPHDTASRRRTRSANWGVHDNSTPPAHLAHNSGAGWRHRVGRCGTVATKAATDQGMEMAGMSTTHHYAEPSSLVRAAYRLLYDPLRAGYLRRLVGSLELTGRERVLDFGSGAGSEAVYLARALQRGGRLTCLDVSPTWLGRGASPAAPVHERGVPPRRGADSRAARGDLRRDPCPLRAPRRGSGRPPGGARCARPLVAAGGPVRRQRREAAHQLVPDGRARRADHRARSPARHPGGPDLRWCDRRGAQGGGTPWQRVPGLTRAGDGRVRDRAHGVLDRDRRVEEGVEPCLVRIRRTAGLPVVHRLVRERGDRRLAVGGCRDRRGAA